MAKLLPHGNYIFVRNLPPDVTDESVAEWFAQYIPITADHVSDQNREKYSTAFVCIDKACAVHLMAWAFENAEFPGAQGPMRFALVHDKRKKQVA